MGIQGQFGKTSLGWGQAVGHAALSSRDRTYSLVGTVDTSVAHTNSNESNHLHGTHDDSMIEDGDFGTAIVFGGPAA